MQNSQLGEAKLLCPRSFVWTQTAKTPGKRQVFGYEAREVIAEVTLPLKAPSGKSGQDKCSSLINIQDFESLDMNPVPLFPLLVDAKV